MLPFPVGLDNQIPAPGTSGAGRKTKPPLVDAQPTAGVPNATRMQMLPASIDLKHAQIFRELQKSTARATRTQQATSSARRNTALDKWYQCYSKNIDTPGVTDFRQTPKSREVSFHSLGS